MGGRGLAVWQRDGYSNGLEFELEFSSDKMIQNSDRFIRI